MTAPTNHHMTITLPDGKHVRGQVVYLPPEAGRLWILATVALRCAL
jgi:hypothetical protein